MPGSPGKEVRMRLTEDGLMPVWQDTLVDRHVGHAHFWERALTRRQFLGTAAAAGGAAATAAMWMPQVAQATGGTPTPIPGGTKLPFQPTPFHFYFPTANPFSEFNVENGKGDPSLIFDFKGNIALADLHGTGTGTDTATGTETSMFWAADVRSMKGTFVFQEGNTGRGAFAFI
jgi:hypothetical protein